MSSAISHSFTMRFLNKTLFEYIRKYIKRDLESDAQLDEWFKINKDSLSSENIRTILNKDLKNMTLKFSECEKKCILQFHEYEIMSKDSSDYKLILFGMIRGVFNNWHHLFLIEFDMKFCEKIIINSIRNLNSLNFEVVALVTTWYQTNKWWSKLGVTLHKPYFENPVNKKPIFVFPDMPNILNILKDVICSENNLIEPNNKMIVKFLPDVKNRKFEDFEFSNVMGILDMIFKWSYYVDKFSTIYKSPLFYIKDENSLRKLLDDIKKLLSDFLQDKCPSLLFKCVVNEILLATKSLQLLNEYLKDNFLVQRLFVDTIFSIINCLQNICKCLAPPKIVIVNVTKMLNENEKLIEENLKIPLPVLDFGILNYSSKDILLSSANDCRGCDSPLLNESLPGLDTFMDVLTDVDDDNLIF